MVGSKLRLCLRLLKITNNMKNANALFFQKRHFQLPVLGLLSFIFISADKNRMELKVTNQIILTDVPSASGIEILGDSIYMIGDNTPWLFKLDNRYSLIEKHTIYSLSDLENDTIKKAVKPDFEAMTFVEQGDKRELFIFGSGSKSPYRELLVKISTESDNTCTHFSLNSFYTKLKLACGFADAELNIEAAIYAKESIYLFNRGKNTIIQFSLSEFNDFIEQKIAEMNFTVFAIELPKINETSAGFSGATFWPEQQKIIFTASVENTSNWIDDGAMLGSFVGILDLKDLQNNMKPVCLPVQKKGKNLPVKIESVAILSSKKNKLNLIMVVDTDGAASELIEADLSF